MNDDAMKRSAPARAMLQDSAPPIVKAVREHQRGLAKTERATLAAFGNLPRSFTIWGGDLYTNATKTVAALASQQFLYEMYVSAANANNGDTFTFYPQLAGGDYIINILGTKHNTRGIMDLSINDEYIASFDWYASSQTLNIEWDEDITLTGGLHKFTLTINGKNGSSSDYTTSITRISIYPR